MRQRRWGVLAFRNDRGAPMVSLGIHIDLHTPRVDLHLPIFTVCIGRLVWQREPGRFFYTDEGTRWSGHTDDCSCERPVPAGYVAYSPGADDCSHEGVPCRFCGGTE